MKKIFSILLLAIALSLVLTSCGLDVPRPEIKTGEFNFSVIYEYGGETKTVTGVYVCEYEGIDWAIDSDFHRDWSGYIKDGKMDGIIKLGDAEDGGEVQLNLHFNPDHFMGDEFIEGEDPFEAWISVVFVDGEGVRIEHDADVVAELYGARIIDYEYDEPISNSFSLFN